MTRCVSSHSFSITTGTLTQPLPRQHKELSQVTNSNKMRNKDTGYGDRDVPPVLQDNTHNLCKPFNFIHKPDKPITRRWGRYVSSVSNSTIMNNDPSHSYLLKWHVKSDPYRLALFFQTFFRGEKKKSGGGGGGGGVSSHCLTGGVRQREVTRYFKKKATT